MGFMDQLALPPEMTRRDQWIVWDEEMRDGERTKVPIKPYDERDGRKQNIDPDHEDNGDPEEYHKYAGSTWKHTWRSYEQAQWYLDNGNNDAEGLGFVFTPDDPLVGVDLDHLRDPETGKLEEKADDIVRKLESYTEISPSGDGLHIIVRGQLPSGRNRHDGVEMYEEGRFFTVTGNRLPGTEPTVKRRDGPLKVMHHKYVKREPQTKDVNASTPSDTDMSLENEQVLTRAKNSDNGKKFEALWNGQTSGYPSHSEADLALCSYLAFWTGGDKQQMDELFRQSGMMRPKWDRQHASDGRTYGEITIDTAVESSDNFFGDQ